MKSAIITLAAALAVAAVVVPAQADTNLVTNGSFTSTTAPGSGELGSLNGNTLNATGWSTSGYNFLYTSATAATTTGANGDSGNVTLWPGLAGTPLVNSPDGGNFVALDGVFEGAPLTQTVNGLVAGQTYTLSFYFAAAQQNNRDGATTDTLDVSIGGSSFATPTVSDASHGFVPWQQENFTFTASSSSELLSFMAQGTPSGDPPFSLLDGVSITSTPAVPEPSSLALLATGFFGVGGMLRSRFNKSQK